MAIDITTAEEYAEVIKNINFWYGNDAQKVINIANEYGLTPEQLTQDWLTGWQGEYTVNGQVMSYNSVGVNGINYATAAEEAANSNAGSITQVALKTPVETTLNQQTGQVTVSSGLTSVATGAKSALTFISKEVLPAVSAAGLGISLGKVIDSTLYNLNPDFWDNNGMATLNPETWNSITEDYPDGFLKRAFNTVFGLNPNTGETQLYLDENAAAYLAMYMQQNGVFNAPTEEASVDSTTEESMNFQTYHPPFALNTHLTTYRIHNGNTYNAGTATMSGNAKIIACTPTDLNSYISIVASDTSGKIGSNYDPTTGWTFDITTNASYTYNNKTVYYRSNSSWSSDPLAYIDGATIPYLGAFGNDAGKIAWVAIYGTITQHGAVEGINNQPNSTQPDFTGCVTPNDYLQALQTQFPDLFNNAVTQSIVNPDGTTSTRKYIPIGTSSENNQGNKTQPVTNTSNSGNTQQNTIANPTTINLTGLENLIKTLTETISQTGTPTNPENPDPTGTGTTPPVVVPTGSASALWSVYNPSQAQLNSFGAWLWSSNFIDQVLKLFNNPMQSIIGVHKIFATPATSGAGNIMVGYLDSGVAANLVSNQYTDIDCGTVKVSEQFGNVFDYTDTRIRLYLPFIGIVDLDTDDVMRGSVKVVYHVDVITGACLADVKISRDGAGGVLYQFAGDAAVRYPISSGSYIGVVSGIASAIGGVASAVMTGGATLPLAAGAIAGGIGSAKTQVQHSGNFSGNAGAMGAKKPYIIIERPQTMIADGFSHYQGKGANARRTVAQMSGYFKFSDVHTESISKAAESEIEAIRAALESGVIA